MPCKRKCSVDVEELDRYNEIASQYDTEKDQGVVVGHIGKRKSGEASAEPIKQASCPKCDEVVYGIDRYANIIKSAHVMQQDPAQVFYFLRDIHEMQDDFFHPRSGTIQSLEKESLFDEDSQAISETAFQKAASVFGELLAHLQYLSIYHGRSVKSFVAQMLNPADYRAIDIRFSLAYHAMITTAYLHILAITTAYTQDDSQVFIQHLGTTMQNEPVSLSDLIKSWVNVQDLAQQCWTL
ncbi:MAG: hypothetical protein Q9160_008079 [Pyrenula sp. 1 TL-2023]